ncbi:putative protein C22orf46 [Galemys pyrenaicus]|uniref:Retinitis pigmentosa 1-like 1 protein n=1 Tax=Galemys pyrenaicus TaxID=202257 RepID=A0A8J6DS78_GALPY|nr:putative protein C22orf46 [Galemys pyrenaicus]
MLLPLLGACALVGPFQGAEWEPVRALLSEHRSCRDPRCCGNLLVLFLFVIWQVRHYWQQATRTHPRMKKTIKVPPQKSAEPSMRCDPSLELLPELLFSPGKFRGLDAHGRQWAWRRRWECQRSLHQSWTQHLLSRQCSWQRPSWGVISPAESVSFSSFSSTCMLSRDSSWEALQGPWWPHDDQMVKPGKHRRMEQLPVHAQEEPESAARVQSRPVSVSSATSFPKVPSTQRLQFCSRELLLVPSTQWGGTPWSCPHEVRASERESQMRRREDSRWAQALGGVSQKENREEKALQASGRQLPIGFAMKDDAEIKDLEVGSQRPVIRQTDGESLTPAREKQDHMGVETRTNIQELGGRDQREGAGENPSETQACRGQDQEQLRCKTDVETQTPAWGDLGKSSNGDAVETRAFEKNQKEGVPQTHGSGNQAQPGNGDGEETQVPGWATQDWSRGDTSTETQAERRNQDQGRGDTENHTQASGRENLEEVKTEEDKETQALARVKQDVFGGENLIEIPVTEWEKQGQDRCENPGESQTSGGEIQKGLRCEVQVGCGTQNLQRGEGAEETQIPRRQPLKEIRQEDWMVMEVQWWGDQRPVINEIVREFEMPPWGKQDQRGGEHRGEIQVPEKRAHKKDGSEGWTDALVPKAGIQEQLTGEIHAEPRPPGRRNQEHFEKEQSENEDSTDIQASEQTNPTGVKGEASEGTQELGEEKQGQLSSEVSGTVNTPKWKTHEGISSKDGANTQASEAENWGKVLRESDGRTRLMDRKKEDRAGGENGAEVKAPGKGQQREAGGEEDAAIWGAEEGNQSQLRGDTDGKTHLSEWENQEQMGGENGAEIEALEKRKQREFGNEDDVETQRLGRENQRKSCSETGERLPPGRRNCEQTGDKIIAENQISDKTNEREVGSEDGRDIQKLREANQSLLQSKVHGNTCLAEWQNQEQIGGENDTEIQIPGERNQSGTRGGDDTETQAPKGDEQKQLRSEADAEIQIQGQGNQNKDGYEDAADIPDVGSRRMCRCEDAGGSRGNTDQSRGTDVARPSLPVDCSESEEPPALPDSGHKVREQEEAVTSAPCPEIQPLSSQEEVSPLAYGKGEHLASQNLGPSSKGRVEVPTASWQARPKPQRRRQRDKEVGPGEASSLTEQLQNPQSVAAPWGPSPACPSVSCDQAPQAATALVGVPSALTVLPKWPVLKKSQRLLLESLMRRKMAHLQWGLPKRILTSHSLSDFKGFHSALPLAGAKLSGVDVRELQGQQGAQSSRPGPVKPPRPPPPVRKNSRLPTRVRTLEKSGPHWPASSDTSIRPEKPKRSQPPGGAREPQEAPAGAPSGATLGDPRESRSCSVPERVGELSSESSRGRTLVTSGVSQLAERAPGTGRASYSRTRHDSWEGACPPQQPPKPPRRGRRGSLERAEGRGARQQPCSCPSSTASFKGGLSSAAGLGRTLLHKIAGGPHLAKPQHSAPNLGLRDPGSKSLPRGGDSHSGADSVRVHTLKRDLQSPGPCCSGATLAKTEGPQDLGVPENPKGVPRNPSAPRKFGLVKNFRCFLHQHGFRK